MIDGRGRGWSCCQELIWIKIGVIDARVSSWIGKRKSCLKFNPSEASPFRPNRPNCAIELEGKLAKDRQRKMDLLEKIQRLVNHGSQIDEDQVRSLMILIRKQLELVDKNDRSQYSTVNLFCNWCAHTEITQSLVGLRLLGRINDTLVKVKTSYTDEVRKELSQAVGLDTFQLEINLLFEKLDIKHQLSNKKNWRPFLNHLVEIIKDVPLAFPPVSKLSKDARKIYKKIIQNPIKSGAGVIFITLRKVDFSLLDANGLGEMMCLLIQTEDSTTIVVPLEI